MTPPRSSSAQPWQQLLLLDADLRVVAWQGADVAAPAELVFSALRPGDRIDEHLARLDHAGVPRARRLRQALTAACAGGGVGLAGGRVDLPPDHEAAQAAQTAQATQTAQTAQTAQVDPEAFSLLPLQQPPGWWAVVVQGGPTEGDQRQRLEELVVDRTVQLAAARESAEAARSSQAEFLAHMSHEVRTPLNAIVGLTHLMRRDPGLTDSLARRLADVQSAARHLQAIVDDVLDLERLESGDGALRDEPFELHTLLDEVRALVQGEADLKGVSLAVEQAAPTSTLRGDGPRLRQALLNLATEALCQVRIARLTLRSRVLARACDGVLLRLEAQGSGPDPRHHRAPAPAALQPEGMRLALTRRLAQRMGGLAGHDTLGDGGRLWWFSVRAAEVHEQVEPRRGPAIGLEATIRRRHGGARVLLAEDNEVNRLVLVELLTDAGLTVDTAEDGEQAVVMAGRRPYDLVLLDLRMPRRDGLSAAREMRRMPAMRQVPIMATTANAFDEDRRACAAAGMDAFLAKPIEVDLLYELVLSWLDRTRGAGPAAEVRPTTDAVTADADGRRLLQLLRGAEGIDAGGGLAAVGGRPAVYRRLLGVFCHTHRDDAAQLADGVALGDLAAARDLAHRIRGGAATLGLVDIEQTAAEVETLLEADAAPSEAAAAASLQRFGQALHETLARIEEALSQGHDRSAARCAPADPSL